MAEPRIKLTVSFFLIMAVTVMKHWYFPAAVSVLCAVITLKLRIFRDYSKKLIFPLFLGLFIFVFQSLTPGVHTAGQAIISVNPEGAGYGFLIFSRVFASASVLILLIHTTPESELLETMRWFRVPGTMLEISSFMSRYIKTFSEEGRTLKLAQVSRCGFLRKSNYNNRMHNIASICGALITRAFARSDEVNRAMLSRAWKPQLRYSTDIPPLNKKDVVLGMAFFSGVIGLVGFDRFL